MLGGGPIGVELAQAMARLGSTVTIVEARSLLARDDAEAAAIVRRALLREGVTLHEQASVLRAEAMRGGVRLVLAGAARRRRSRARICWSRPGASPMSRRSISIWPASPATPRA